MEKVISNNRIVIGVFGLVFTCITLMYSCSKQTSLAQGSSIPLIPKEWSPSAFALKQSQQQNKDLQKQITPLQKQLQQDLPEVLSRSKKAFSEITDIKSMLDYMNVNSIAERDLFLRRATELRVLNDTLIHNQITSNNNINRLIGIVLSERDARIANEIRTADDRKLNQSNVKAQNLYTGILFSLLIALLIILLLMWLDVKRIKAKYKQQLQNG